MRLPVSLLAALLLLFASASCKPAPPPEPPPPPLEVQFSNNRPIDVNERVRSYVSAHLEGGDRGHEVYQDVTFKMTRRRLEDTSSQRGRVFIEYERATTMKPRGPDALAVDAKSYIVGVEDRGRFYVDLERRPANSTERAFLAADYNAFDRVDPLGDFLVDHGIFIEAQEVEIAASAIELPRGFWQTPRLDAPEGSLTLERILDVSGRDAAHLALTLTGTVVIEVGGRAVSANMALRGHSLRDIETARELELTLDGKLEVVGGAHRGQRYDFTLRVRHEYPLPSNAKRANDPEPEDVPADKQDDLSSFEE